MVAPVIMRAPTGLIVNEVQLPPVGLFRAAVEVVSSVSPAMVSVIVLPVWVAFALIASNAAFNVA